MKRSRRMITALAALAGFAAAAGPLQALAEEPCVELKYRGEKVIEIPCPGELAKILDLPFLQAPKPDKDRFERQPDIPGDHGMVIDPEQREGEGKAADPDIY